MPAESKGQLASSVTTINGTFVTIASGQGIICSVLLTSTSGNSLAVIYDTDGVSGPTIPLLIVPSASAMGKFFSVNMPFVAGISVKDFSNPAGKTMTVSYTLG